MNTYLKIVTALFLMVVAIWIIGGAVAGPQRNITEAPLATSTLPATITPVGVSYSKDENHVYNAGGGIISDADPATFKLCDSDPGHAFCAKDASHVYYDGAVLQNADPGSFVVLNLTYGKDNNHIFFLYGGEEGPLPHLIASAVSNSFMVVGSVYGKDTNSVYDLGVSISPPIDPKTFSLINDLYVKDGNHVYVAFAGKVTTIVGADPETFTLLNKIANNQYAYAKDKSHIYYAAKLVPDADMQTFKIVLGNGYDAEDKVHKYFEGNVVN